MPLSKEVITTLVDLVENKLAVMQIGDRDDLREMVVLQHCLSELRGLGPEDMILPLNPTDIPRRGRHRKLSAIMEDMRCNQTRRRA